MAFTAECPFCRLRIQKVPERRAGASLECPRCGNPFTLAEIMPAPRGTLGGVAATVAAPAVVCPGVATAVEIETPASAFAPPVRARRPANYFGLLAFFLASLACLSLSVPEAGGFAVPLAGLALALSGVALLAPVRARGVVAGGLGLVVGTCVLGVAVYRSGVFTREADDPLGPPGAQAVVHLHDQGVQNYVGRKEDDWVDAGRDAAQVDDVRVRVVGVAVETLAPAERSARRPPAERRLVVRLRVSNAGGDRLVPYAGWGTMADAGPTIRDETGRVYPARPHTGRESGKPVTRAELPPEKWVDDVVVFDAPGARTGALQLELPGRAVAVEGPLRFLIPRAMIRGGP